MQTRRNTNKSPINQVCSGKQINIVICLRMGKTNTEKTPPGEFKVTAFENPLLSKQAVTSKGIQYLIPT